MIRKKVHEKNDKKIKIIKETWHMHSSHVHEIYIRKGKRKNEIFHGMVDHMKNL